MKKVIKLNIGKEEGHVEEIFPRESSHLLNIKSLDEPLKTEAHKKVSLDLKEEIKAKSQAGRICVVGEFPESKRGLGRLPMIASALLLVLFLNIGQLMFVGKQAGKEGLALAGEAFSTIQTAGQAFLSGDEGADIYLFDKSAELLKKMEAQASPLLGHKSLWLDEPKQVKSIRSLLEAGHLVPEIGKHVASAKLAFENLPAEGSLTDYIEQISAEHIEPASQKISLMNSLLQEVDLSSTPYQEAFLEFRKSFKEASAVFDLWVDAKDPVLTMLGADLPQHYLVLLQNNDEMRIGGGFIGSFALIELNDGRLTQFDFHDVYDFDNSYHEHVEVPIHELRNLTKEWRLRDSNISADFEVSAKHAMRFLELEGGPGVDGVIGVNLSSAQALLEVTGPLGVSSLPKALSAENFPTVLSTLVEAKTFGENSPKIILGEFLESFIKTASQPENRQAIGTALLSQMQKKQISIFHKDESVQDFISSMGLSANLPILGEMENDFFMPVFTNIGANKTDRYISTNLTHDTYLMEDGAMLVAISVERKHNFTDATKNWIQKELADYGFTAWNEGLWKTIGADRNKTGIRIYVPENARLEEVQGAFRDEIQFFYDPEMDLSYYYLEQSLQTGESKNFTVFFSLPWRIGKDFEEYEFNIFKQPGLKNVQFSKRISSPKHMVLSSYPFANSSSEDFNYILEGSFDSDIDGRILFKSSSF